MLGKLCQFAGRLWQCLSKPFLESVFLKPDRITDDVLRQYNLAQFCPSLLPDYFVLPFLFLLLTNLIRSCFLSPSSRFYYRQLV